MCTRLVAEVAFIPLILTTRDIPGSTSTEDPGWIRLAEADFDGGSIVYDEIDFGSIQLDFGDFIQFSMDFGETGSWSLKVNEDAVDAGQSLGLESFDHLAFVVKQGNSFAQQGVAGFAVYDFNFQEFFDKNVIGTSTAYNFYGSFDLSGIHGNGFSHASVWARDPAATTTEMPVAATLALLGLGLAGLGWSRRKKV